MQFYVKDIMTTDIITVKETDTIRDAVKVFSDNKIYGVPVVDEEGYVVGVISVNDIVKKESSMSFYYSPFMKDLESIIYNEAKFFDRAVSTIMSKDLFTVTPEDTIAKMAKEMYEKKIHRLLVSEYNKIIGIVSTFDLLKLLATSDEDLVV